MDSKNLKRIKIIFSLSGLILVCALTSFFWRSFQKNSPKISQKEHRENPQQRRDRKWETYHKISKKKTQTHLSTKEEKDLMKLENLSSQEDLSSQETRKEEKKEEKKEDQRAWRGIASHPLPSQIDNEVHPKWKEKLGKDLMRFLPLQTKSFIRKERSALILHRGKYLNVEKVAIKILTLQGRHFGYNAYVNSETGKIIKTWNRTIHEDMSKSPLKLHAHKRKHP